MRGNLSMRRRLFAVALLAALTGLGALVMFAELARTTWDQRRIDGREAAQHEVERLHRLFEGAPTAETRRAGVRHFGALRSGIMRADLSDETGDTPFAPAFYRGRAEAAAESARTGEIASLEATKLDGAMFAIAVRVLPGGAGYAWAAFKLETPPSVVRWRAGVLALGVASLLLVLASLHTLSIFDRGVGSIVRSLVSLGRDLRSPVARPRVGELAAIADGVAALARGLDAAQGERDALTRELSHRERLAALGRVVAGVAHEVRNPLAAIKLRVEVALDAGDLGPRHARELTVVAEEVARLDRLVADLLLVAGKNAGARSAVDLGELAARRVKLLEPWSAERGVHLVARGSAPAEVDADAVARLLDNLIRNAVEASPAGARVEVCASGEGGESRVEVLDEGDGVPENHSGELFEPFFSTKAQGTGLGLAISRAIAAAHHGALTYRRDAERTSFTATFPRVPSDR